MQLSVNGHILSITHLGPDFVVVERPIDHPPCEAEISVSIDGCTSRWQVELPDGLATGQSESRIQPFLNGSTAR